MTRSGQARIQFTTAAGSTITGIGQGRRVNGERAMEMQMITGGNGAFTTHWAYMLPLTAGTEPPDPRTADGDQRTYRSGRYRWLRGTSWNLAPQNGNRQKARGRFEISGYRNGYFWGEGSRGQGDRPFHVLGSVTPEGNLFFNAIGASNFRLRISQGGLLTGPRRQASARLRPYSDATGQLKQPLALERISLERGHTQPGGTKPSDSQPSDSKARRDKLTGIAADRGGVSTDQRQDLLLHSPLQRPLAGQPWAGQSWIPSGLAPSSVGEGDGGARTPDALAVLGGVRPTAGEITRPGLGGFNAFRPDLGLIA